MAESKIGAIQGLKEVSTGINGIDAFKSGRVVTIQCWNVDSQTASSGATLWTLPAELIPAIIMDFRDAYSQKRIQIETDGKIVTREALSNNIIRFSVTYISAR